MSINNGRFVRVSDPLTSPPYKLYEEVRGRNNIGVDFNNLSRPSTLSDVVSLSSFPLLMEEEAEGLIPYPWKVSLAYPLSRSYLEKYLSDGVVRVGEVPVLVFTSPRR